MGQKANPNGLRLGIIRDWESTWFSENGYADLVLEDFNLRKTLRESLSRAGVSKIHIKRKANVTEVDVTVAKPGIVLGKGGVEVNALQAELTSRFQKAIKINVIEEKNPDLSSRLVGEWVCAQLEKRVVFRRAMKMAVQRTLKSGAKGVKICCAGRLGGAEIARTEWYREGKVPLHTFRADIDYAFCEALTTYGKIGVKVWIYRGEVFTKKQTKQNVEEANIAS
jgi:small subunit ribosomal protein S3